MELGELKSAGLVDYQTLLIENEKLRQDIDQYKRERDTLIKDIEKLREENNNLKQSVSDYKNLAEWHVANWYEYKALQHENRTLKDENKALRLQADEYFKLWQEQERKYNKLTEHIRLKALHNPSISRYKDLMCFINEMEDE